MFAMKFFYTNVTKASPMAPFMSFSTVLLAKGHVQHNVTTTPATELSQF
jgi:hypothetical protein